jgi:hypothetical protein
VRGGGFVDTDMDTKNESFGSKNGSLDMTVSSINYPVINEKENSFFGKNIARIVEYYPMILPSKKHITR